MSDIFGSSPTVSDILEGLRQPEWRVPLDMTQSKMLADEVIALRQRVRERTESLDACEKSRDSALDTVATLTGERDAFAAIAVRVVPGEHGEGVEVPMTPESLKEYVNELHDGWDAAEKRLTAELNEAKQDASGAYECLSMVADRLAAHGCEHNHDRKGTPPMFYPEWINCVVAHAVKKAESTVAEMKEELRKFGAVMVHVVPGEHGEGEEVPATPESIRASLDGLQDEWDNAERRVSALKEELKGVRQIVVDLYAIVRLQNGNLHADINAIQDRAANWLAQHDAGIPK